MIDNFRLLHTPLDGEEKSLSVDSVFEAKQAMKHLIENYTKQGMVVVQFVLLMKTSSGWVEWTDEDGNTITNIEI